MNQLKKLFGKSGNLLPLFLFFTFSLNGQTKTNLDLFFQLADSAVTGLIQNLGNERNVQIDFVLGKDYQVFQNSILSHFQNKELGKTRVQFALKEAKVEYSEPERKNLFGSFVVKRILLFSGNYSIISEPTTVKNFSYTLNDEIPYENIEAVENSSFPFTRGKIPEEPFFSSLLEPAIALGSAAAAVYIFFSARSK